MNAVRTVDEGKRVKMARELLVPDHVTEVLSVQDVRRQYRDDSSKRELCKSYDLFLLERSIRDISNKLLGANLLSDRSPPEERNASGGRFVEMKKVPVLVHLTRHPEVWIKTIESEKKNTQMFCHVHQERSIRFF